jgi:hypothetical protein
MNLRPGFGAHTISTLTAAFAAASVTVEPVWPLSAQRWAMVGATCLALRSQFWEGCSIVHVGVGENGFDEDGAGVD